ncbi:hypothetical protein PUNSTDRAFT_135771 [Punctularia strigosozonata HHB-11173 SS5]|uniref:uncharacterized protein n=1 Tax=Punctularia strigosozonata (strain HHB-11173) TaxID=741275 RepID=UPI00044180D7|nr:uncharacterized protein PUNSTDRAFT_135771 [Punctularia strigosozonata HHB-11173 SS5]EIN07082.1 hypothetical protein PUNSTDRAFT_135771 [Punctularia strigosozonata HHB-11173 SS5]
MAAARLARLPRFTLYSGPNCSLCDVAKIELAKVRQQRPFNLEVVNIQDPGQERWKKKYVWWIPALHLEGKEVAKGRWDAQAPVLRDEGGQGLELGLSSCFIDTEPSQGHEVTDVLYIPQSITLGETDSTPSHQLEAGVGARRCFNCGKPEHTLASCLVPRNDALISLSRQLFDFFRARERGASDGPSDLHDLQARLDWQMRRLDWLERFCPGHVRGHDLRDALGLDPHERGADEHGPVDSSSDDAYAMPWLSNMAIWGYPKGWASATDPRETVRRRILEESVDDGVDDEDEDGVYLWVFGEDEAERVLLHNVTTIDEEKECPSPEDGHNTPTPGFRPIFLPIYSGSALPPVPEESPVPRPHDGWRFPGMLSLHEMLVWSRPFDNVTGELTAEWRAQHLPPPPAEPPPPLPPPPSLPLLPPFSPPHPPPCEALAPHGPCGSALPSRSGPSSHVEEDSDMDVSDDD